MTSSRISCRDRRLFFLLVLIALSVSPSVSFGQVTRFAVIGDYGGDNVNEGAVASLAKSWNPDFVITAGDNSYGSNLIDNNIGKYYHEYIGAYTGSYPPGSATNRFFPSLGNHDYSDGAGITAYLNYFTLPGAGVQSTGSSGNERYYDFTIGPVQFLVINSNIQEPDSITATGLQAQWLQAQLAASTSRWKIVYFHHAAYSSSSNHGSTVIMQWPYEDWGADIVIGGHDHTYERILRDDDDDGVTIPYFVNGLGGRSIYGFVPSGFVAGSKVRYNANYGAQLVEATPYLITLKFYSIAGGPTGTLIDSYSLCDCHGTRGNLNGDVADVVDSSDLTVMVEYLFFGGRLWNCPSENNVDAQGGVDISDLSALVDYLFFGASLPVCQ
ncbi:MAG: metallophosphoesterase [Candidatus Zixiibacteriota bacterium]